jgi:sugar/nucleoside kinase (ribokinase family)
MTGRVLVAGDVNIDIVLSGLSHLPRAEQDVVAEGLDILIGGQGATTARALARLGLHVSIAGRVGQDDYGRRALVELRADGVDVTGIAVDPALQTGTTVILSAGTERAFATYMGSISALRRSDIGHEKLENADHLHLSSFYLQTMLRPGLPQLFDEAHQLGLTISVDPGWDSSNEWRSDIFDILKRIDVFLPNELEAMTITATGTVEEALAVLANSTQTVVIKRGDQGAIARNGTMVTNCPSFPVHVVDVTSAGDVFNAGFLYAYLAGWDTQRALEFANACGALATTRVGSLGVVSGVGEVEAFLNAHGRTATIPPIPRESKHDGCKRGTDASGNQ